MYEGVQQDQFHQFLAAAAAASSSTPPMRAAPTHHHHHHHHQPLPPHLSFSLLHGCTSPPPPPPPPPVFDSYPHPQPPSLHHQQIQQQLHLQWPPPAAAHSNKHLGGGGGGGVKQEGESGERMTSCGFLSTSLVVERDRSIMAPNSDFVDSDSDSASWSPDELLALLRIRSALDNCFPSDFTWEHVSRKLSEMGFKRSPQKCKEKFEEESRSYLFQPSTTANSTANDTSKINNNNNSYRLFSELEELYNHGHDQPSPPHHPHHHMLQQQPASALIPDEDGSHENQVTNPQREEQEQEQEEEMGSGGGEGNEEITKEERLLEENDGSDATHDDKIDDDDEVEGEQIVKSQRKKRRFEHHQTINSKKKFEIFKSFCEEIVNKMMNQQEELHNKILQDMIRRDEEKFAREEAWKKQEMDRVNLEMEARARDLALVAQRQAKIIEFLNKFSTTTNNNNNNNNNDKEHQNPSSTATIHSSSNEESISQTSTPNTNKIIQPSFRKPRPNKRPRGEDNDIGKRWPREEVLALINIRSNADPNTKTGDDNTNKNAPLWERISQKMNDSGYNRSSKRCKEKWENINKYFRKTKDMNKNRSVDSRTCPYFHQLSQLYNQGRGGSASSDGGDQGDGVTGVQVAISPSDPLEL